MNRNSKSASRISGLIDRGCSVEGKLTFDGTVQINGDFQGDITSDGTLVIGAEAQVRGNIKVDTVIVEGNLNGLVEAKGKVELRRGSRLIADIHTPTIVIEDGAVFHGNCRMIDDKAALKDVEKREVTQEHGLIQEGEDSLMM